MLKNFEKYSGELTDTECEMLPVLIEIINSYSKGNPVNSADLMKQLNAKTGRKVAGERLRKMINVLRYHSVTPVISTQRGYYVSYDQNEINKCVCSLLQRANAIRSAAKGLERIRKNPQTSMVL